jgi:protein phosphatase
MSKLKLTVGTITDRGLNPKREANEDRLLALPECGIFLVADGVGGRRGGEVASQAVVDTFAELFASPPRGELLVLLRQAIARANRNIYETAGEVAELEGMATTLALVAVEGTRAVIAHVGDSRVYRFDGKQLICETEDHTEVAEAVRSGTLTTAQAARHPRRHIINRALGVEPEVEADFKTCALDARTSFLICSDGITRHISDAELAELVSSGAHPQNICTRLKELCFARGAEDNLTAIVIDVGERAYVEEPTRPASIISAPSVSSAVSRISIDFGATEDTNKTTSAQPDARMRRNHAHTQVQAGKWLGRAVQLLIQLLLVALAFFAGRYYDQLVAWVFGRPVIERMPPDTKPDRPNPDLAAAVALFKEGRFELARERFAELAAREPENAEYRYWLGRSYLEMRQYQEAIKNLSEAAQMGSRSPDVYLFLALAQDAVGNHRGVSESLRRAVAWPTP